MLLYAVPLPLLVFRLYRFLHLPVISLAIQLLIDSWLARMGVYIYCISTVLDAIYWAQLGLILSGDIAPKIREANRKDKEQAEKEELEEMQRRAKLGLPPKCKCRCPQTESSSPLIDQDTRLILSMLPR